MFLSSLAGGDMKVTEFELHDIIERGHMART